MPPPVVSVRRDPWVRPAPGTGAPRAVGARDAGADPGSVPLPPPLAASAPWFRRAAPLRTAALAATAAVAAVALLVASSGILPPWPDGAVLDSTAGPPTAVPSPGGVAVPPNDGSGPPATDPATGETAGPADPTGVAAATGRPGTGSTATPGQATPRPATPTPPGATSPPGGPGTPTPAPSTPAPTATPVPDPTPTPKPPTVAFSYTTSGLTATFSNATKGAVTWTWSFGDGSTSTVRNPAHTYASPGTYLVTLTAVGSSGATASAQEQVTVGP
jgi:hypothetical protein